MWKAIINWINSKAYRCEHEWEQIHKADIYLSKRAKFPCATKITYMCNKCGKHKTVKI